jgi:UrcA family protein
MRALAIFAAAAAVLAAAPAFAAGPELTAGQVTVRLGDLDLATSDGAHTAIARLARAAADACAAGETPALIRMSDAYQRCRAQTLETAAARIHTSPAAFDEVQGRTVQLVKR